MKNVKHGEYMGPVDSDPAEGGDSRSLCFTT